MRFSREVREAFGKLGKKGGKARAKALTPEARANIAKQGAAARWAKYRASHGKPEDVAS